MDQIFGISVRFEELPWFWYPSNSLWPRPFDAWHREVTLCLGASTSGTAVL